MSEKVSLNDVFKVINPLLKKLEKESSVNLKDTATAKILYSKIVIHDTTGATDDLSFNEFYVALKACLNLSNDSRYSVGSDKAREILEQALKLSSQAPKYRFSDE